LESIIAKVSAIMCGSPLKWGKDYAFLRKMDPKKIISILNTYKIGLLAETWLETNLKVVK